MKYNNTEQIWNEMRALCPAFAGVTYERLDKLGTLQWPCPTEEHPGTPYLYKENRFNTASGKGQLFATEWRPPLEQPDSQYPLILSTVREVGHYSARTMTGNCAALQVLADEPGYIQISEADAERLGIQDQELVWVASRRGKVISRASVTDRANIGAVYMTYQWWIGACNELTIHHVDPISKTPEYKYCAVSVEKIADQDWAEQYVQEEYSKIKAQMKTAV